MKSSNLLILLLTVSIFLSSCGIIIINKKEDGGEETSSETSQEITYIPPEYPTLEVPNYENEAKALLEALPDRDLDGLTVMIAAATESGDIFNDVEGGYVSAVLKRNSMIADKYNTLIVTDYQTSEALTQKVKSANKSGDFYADFAVIRSSDVGSYYYSSYLQNLRSLTYYDFEAEYFNAQAMDQLTLNNVIYGAVGSMTESPESYGCLYFNKELGKQLGISVDYELLHGYGFTWDTLLTQLNSIDTDKALVCSSYGNQTLSSLSLLASGQTFLTRNSKGDLASSFNNSTTLTLVSKLKGVTAKKTDTLNITSGDNGTVTLSGLDIFVNGQSLYAFGLLSDMSVIANCGFDWEVLPMPKLTEDGGYYSAASFTAPVLTMLKTSPNIETNGYILQALGAASYKHLKSAYVKHAMTSYVSGIYTADMIELITENSIYDHAHMFGPAYSSLRNGTYITLNNAVANKSSLTYYVNRTKSKLQSYLNARN